MHFRSSAQSLREAPESRGQSVLDRGAVRLESRGQSVLDRGAVRLRTRPAGRTPLVQARSLSALAGNDMRLSY